MMGKASWLAHMSQLVMEPTRTLSLVPEICKNISRGFFLGGGGEGAGRILKTQAYTMKTNTNL